MPEPMSSHRRRAAQPHASSEATVHAADAGASTEATAHAALSNQELARGEEGPPALARGVQLLNRVGVAVPSLMARGNTEMLALMREGDPVLAAAAQYAQYARANAAGAAGGEAAPRIPAGSGQPLPSDVQVLSLIHI